MNLRLLTLDATGTIFKFRRSPLEDYVTIAGHYGFKLDLDLVKKRFKKAYRKMEVQYPHFGSLSHLDSMQWWLHVAQDTLEGSHHFQNDQNVFKPIALHLYKYYSTAAAYEVYPDFLEFSKKFRSENRHVKTAVVSNFDKRLTNILAELGLLPFIDHIVFSEEAQSSKPEPEIFLAAVRRSGLQTEEPCKILHIGDDITKDYHGAKALGWKSFLLNRRTFSYPEMDEVPNHLICNDFYDVDKSIKDLFK